MIRIKPRLVCCVRIALCSLRISSSVTSSRKAIVIVDDEKAYVDIMATLLTDQLDCPVVTFTRPLEALAALPNLNVGVIVTDCKMPQFNGLEFIRRAPVLLPGIPFILMTGTAQHPGRRRK